MIFILVSLLSITTVIWVRQLLELIRDEIHYAKLLKVKGDQEPEQ